MSRVGARRLLNPVNGARRRGLVKSAVWAAATAAAFLAWSESDGPVRGQSQLNEHCVVSILNRTAQVHADGSWELPNIPAGFGPVRARATCIENGITRSGESDFFTIVSGRMNAIPPIILGPTTPIPQSLEVTANPTTLFSAGQTTQLAVAAAYAGGTTRDVTNASAGTTYLTTNAAIASVSPNGLVTAGNRSGTVLIRASNEGTPGLLAIDVRLAGDTDGDGIPDDVELAEGLNPNDPADGFEDADHDGLSNRDEIARGTNLRNPDTDGDGVRDGDEVKLGINPLLADTDGDGIRDGLEIATGSDPKNAGSINLAAALSRIDVAPQTFVLTVNSIVGEASIQLTVTGRLTDGTTIDLTSTLRGTNYGSSNLSICNFGQPDGRVFGSAPGPCVVTITNSGFTATSSGTVVNFSPLSLGSIAIPGYANNVDVNGSFAYVAAGAAGLVVVSVSNPASPVIVASLDTPGNANDVRVVGNRAYIADGASGLRIIDVTNPSAPANLGAFDTPGEANDVIVAGNIAYVADGAAGVQIIDVTNPLAPALIRTVDTPGTARGVDVEGSTLVVADDSPSLGLRVINVANPATAAIVGNVSLSGEIIDVDISNGFAYVAAYTGGVHVVDVRNPSAPIAIANLPGSAPQGFVPRDVQVAGRFALFAEQLFATAIAPIVDISTPATPFFRGFVDFGQDYAGTGIAVSGPYVYWTGQSFFVGSENGTTGTTRLFIGQYISLEDRAGVAPTVAFTQPLDGASAIAGTKLTVRANASDDVAVASVSFFANGQPVFTDTSEPFEFVFNVPASAASVTFTAQAVDFGSNIATAAPVTISVVPDPLTTARGTVVDANGTPVAGATVTALTSTATTATDGTFFISGLPTVAGPISANAVAVVGGVTMRGSSPLVAPVPGGFTELGTITIRRGGKLFATSSQQGISQRSVFTVDTETGALTLIGSPSPVTRPLSDVSFNPITGTMYVMHGSSASGCELLTLDPATAQILARVTITSNKFIQGCDAIAHDASGVLYVGVWSEGRLLTVNPTTGVAMTDIAITGGGGNNHAADLAFDPTTGELWAARGGSFDGRIVRMNKQTAAVTKILDIPFTGIGQEVTGIAFDINGQMYVSISGDQLAKIDKETGAFTFVGTGFGGVKVAGLGFVP